MTYRSPNVGNATTLRYSPASKLRRANTMELAAQVADESIRDQIDAILIDSGVVSVQ
jgi:hypothetical protein